MPPQLSTAQLVVEGKDDQHVVWALCKYYDIDENFEVETADGEKTGVDALLNSIPVRLKVSGLRALGIVLDADTDLAARWGSVRSILIKAGYRSVPIHPDAAGTVLYEHGLPRVGVWLMPDNKLPGILEDFAARLIPSDDQLTSYVVSVLNKIEKDGHNLYRAVDRPKAHIHTWLAWQRTPGQPLGLAITARSLQANSPTAAEFVAWLSQLFGS